MEHNKSEAEVGANLVKEMFSPTVVKVYGENGGPDVSVVALPDGQGGLRLHSTKKYSDEYRTAPEFREERAVMKTVDSFIAHTNRFKDADSLVLADNDRHDPSLTTMIDYHKKTFNGDPRFGRHSVHYQFPLSDEWKKWSNINDQKMSVNDFAEFLEDNIGDIEAPIDKGDKKTDDPLDKILERVGGLLAGPQKLMELAKGLKVNVSEKVHQAQTLASGESQLQFSHEHQDEKGAPIKVPNMFLINIPVFNSGDVFRIPVRLRYRLRSGEITWHFKLYRTDQTFDAAFEDICEKVKKETKLPLHIGRV